MKKNIRQEKLYNYLMSLNHSVSLHSLADDYQCCSKTIRRDIEELAQIKKSPWYIFENQVYVDKERKKRYQLEEGWLTDEELEGLLTLYQSVENLSNGALKLLLNPVKARITGALTQKNPSSHSAVSKVKIIEVANRKLNTKIFQQLHRSASQESVISLHYWKRSHNLEQTRIVSPQQLVRYKDNWYLDAYCHQAGALRSFALDAIKRVTLCNTEYYQKINPTQIQEHFQQSYGIFSGAARQIAILHFDAFISRWIQNETWHPDQITEKQADGSVIMNLPYHHDTELIQDILKYGPNVKVLEPQELKDKIQQRLTQALENYRKE